MERSDMGHVIISVEALLLRVPQSEWIGDSKEGKGPGESLPQHQFY